MSKFDAMRFAEAFGAAILGAAAYERVKGSFQSKEAETVRKFQRALIVASNANSFTQEVADRYLTRIGALDVGDRLKYLRTVLQPSEESFDEKLTALVLFDHALQSDSEWQKTAAVYFLNSSNPLTEGATKITDTISSAGSGVGAWIDNAHDELERRQNKRNETWYGRLENWYRSLR